VEKDFLLAGPSEPAPAAPLTSLLRIRNYPPPVRQTHAACVKIITPQWHGAGVVISADGDILTSYHLVAGAPAVSVQMLDGRLLRVTKVLAASATHDLALLHIEDGPFAFLPVTPTTRPAVQSRLSIVGHPGEWSWKLDSGTVVRYNTESGTEVIHVDADIGRGNSGGPMVDEAGRLCAITACSATLADGSTVKVGVSAQAIAEFLSSPGTPLPLKELAAAEKNRRSAEFLQSLCLLTEEWMHDWLEAMGKVTLADARTPSKAPQEPRVAFLNTERAAEASLKLLLLKTMVARCIDRSTPDPALVASGSNLGLALDRLMDCTAILTQASGSTPTGVRTALEQVRQNHTLATLRFGQALTSLVPAGRTAELNRSNPSDFQRLETLRQHYAPPGSHHTNNGSEG
jgi:hypothetical protein